MIATSTGSLKQEVAPGDIVILNDFIDRTKTRICTFYDGSETAATGVCHIPMSPAFDERTRQVVISTAKEIGVDVHPNGCAVSIEGPRFSTKAESHVFRRFWYKFLYKKTGLQFELDTRFMGLWSCQHDIGSRSDSCQGSWFTLLFNRNGKNPINLQSFSIKFRDFS